MRSCEAQAARGVLVPCCCAARLRDGADQGHDPQRQPARTGAGARRCRRRGEATAGRRSSRLQLVNGFLEAMSDSQAYDVARQYMTPEAAAAWKPESQTVVYDQSPDVAHQCTDDGIQLTARGSPPSTTRGEWNPAPVGRARPTSSSSWPRSTASSASPRSPPGVYLGSNQVDLKLAPRDLYFFTPGRDMLVPDPVYLPLNLSPAGRDPARPGAAEGPDQPAGQRRGHVAPPGTEVQVSVPVEFGVATVALNDTAGSLRDADRRLLAAQIVWTLNQIRSAGQDHRRRRPAAAGRPGRAAVLQLQPVRPVRPRRRR